jgi:hypothetical protein
MVLGQPSSVVPPVSQYAIPHLGYNSQLMYGGLGMVVHTFLRWAYWLIRDAHDHSVTTISVTTWKMAM